ncbi:MAG: Dabb family protein [Actinomycetales bacterium]|nr:Dabb family protein [Actinomycetales bacterium]
MIRHIVLFTLQGDDDAARAAATERLRESLEPLVGVIPGLRSLRLDADGSGVAGHWHAALTSEHDSWEALAGYQSHPDHQRVLREVIPQVALDKAVVDYAL